MNRNIKHKILVLSSSLMLLALAACERATPEKSAEQRAPAVYQAVTTTGTCSQGGFMNGANKKIEFA